MFQVLVYATLWDIPFWKSPESKAEIQTAKLARVYCFVNFGFMH